MCTVSAWLSIVLQVWWDTVGHDRAAVYPPLVQELSMSRCFGQALNILKKRRSLWVWTFLTYPKDPAVQKILHIVNALCVVNLKFLS